MVELPHSSDDGDVLRQERRGGSGANRFPKLLASTDKHAGACQKLQYLTCSLARRETGGMAGVSVGCRDAAGWRSWWVMMKILGSDDGSDFWR